MRYAISTLIFATLLAGIGCGDAVEPPKPAATTATRSPDVWQMLESRPLQLPALAPGEPCPTSTGKTVSPAYAPALGGGPVYPVGLGTDGVLRYSLGGGFAGSEWGGAKVLWISSPDYQGPALIRGDQVDGTSEVRFENALEAQRELRLTVEAWASSPDEEPGWRAWPSYTRLRAPGCYAYQVDGPGLSEVIVFRAIEVP